MIDHQSISVFELMLGVLIVAAVFTRIWFKKIGLPALAGFIALGFVLRVADGQMAFMSGTGRHLLEFLAETGVFILLFRIGLDSNLHGLVAKLPRAAPIWLGNVTISGVPAFLLCHQVFDLGAVPSMFTAIAMTATSVAVTTELWREAGALDTPDGQTLIDVAELDDLSAVIFMAMAVAVAPLIHSGDGGSLATHISEISLILLAKAAALGGLCLAVAWANQHRLAAILTRLGEPHAAMILLGIGLCVAAVASLLGFSIAIGAFFAGLIFSRNTDVVRMETGFVQIQAFFVPFFFIAIGFRIDPASLGMALAFGGALLAVAVGGKIAGAGLPALMTTSGAGALLIGVSMVPRAEMAMVIGQQARDLGDWAMPAEVFSGIALVALATSIATPIVVHILLRRWQPSA
jgi:Kef-type K+ transport system membrane component KefB|tara:strand:- start:746 stop:1960 length:1215 start_codon:yes stop_codon:yes gene_type:complete